MKTIIHVNQHNIKYNSKNLNKKHVITIKTYKKNTYADQVNILDRDNNIIATVKYSPNKPLSCGAKVWIETYNKVQIIE